MVMHFNVKHMDSRAAATSSSRNSKSWKHTAPWTIYSGNIQGNKSGIRPHTLSWLGTWFLIGRKMERCTTNGLELTSS
ncbi:hypothetical protein LR48_Vigan2317s000100 [Vigna angularis]|nr:hypothetical protein LR48_Vigan2317s000100 [Vigna angularis]